jgi:hypothetical protein
MSDITASKIREGALEKNSLLLQATLDSLSHGLSVVDRDRRLIAWNRRFVDLFELPAERLHQGMAWKELAQLLGDDMGSRPGDPDWLPGGVMASPPSVSARAEIKRGARTLRARLNPMPGGGYSTTFSDISDAVAGEARFAELEAPQRLAGRRGVLDLQRRAHHRPQFARQPHRLRQPGLLRASPATRRRRRSARAAACCRAAIPTCRRSSGCAGRSGSASRSP